MIVSLIRTVYFLRLKAENTAVTLAGHATSMSVRNFFLLEVEDKKKENDKQNEKAFKTKNPKLLSHETNLPCYKIIQLL